ncbi:MAG: hypothetical protein LUK37_21505 [Clostridia bacterium]|nr:hypothetical protein [Clostridia bacterium]
MRKRILSVLTAAAIVVSFTGCTPRVQLEILLKIRKHRILRQRQRRKKPLK